ncbi:uncharacterized protein LOC134432715 isoform X2 [Melospiza melodia melodia]|uniref:uncharacterized protein LOC134432715 isoform X2 n=1 Tax=Melospiza melodia melodia TaxID=1914991 RepID=UPI002FD154C1
MEPQELSPALLQPQVTVVAILGELLDTLPSLDEMTLLVSPLHLYWDLMDFTNELRDSLYRIDDTWRHCNFISDDDDPPTSLSQALATHKSSPCTRWICVRMKAWKWPRSVAALKDRWAELARKATKLPNACRDLATKAADRAATATARAKELQDKAARYWTAQENMVKFRQALGGEDGAEVVVRHEAQVRRDAMVAASEARRATMVRQRLEVALGLLERLVAACDEATAFPRELQRRVGDIGSILRWINQVPSSIREDLVVKVAVAEWLWEANAHLAKDHLVGTLQDIIKFYFHDGPTSLSAREVAERCQRAIDDIPRLLRPPDCPQSIPNVSPVTMEPQELSLALLQPQVTVVAILGEMLATLHRRDEMTLLLMSTVSLYRDLEDFTREFRATLYPIDGTWWRQDVPVDEDDPPVSLSQALAAYKSTQWTTSFRVEMEVGKWQRSVDVLVGRRAKLAWAATKLCNTCRVMVTEAGYRAATATAQARELQATAAHYGTAQENMVELGQALGREEGMEVVAGHGAQVKRKARVAAREATRATMVRQRVEVALGLLERLVAACDEATAFPRELQRLLRDTKATLKGTKKQSINVPNALVTKVAMAELLWKTNTRLAKDHLGKTLPDVIEFLFNGGLDSPSACGVAERCQRVIEDIPRLLRPPECPQGVPKVSPVSMELQELSPALLQPQVTMVAILGELLATLPRQDEEMLPVSPLHLYWDLEEFTNELRTTLYCIDDTWRHQNVTVNDDDPVNSLSQALAAYKSTPWISQNPVTMATRKWQGPRCRRMAEWCQRAIEDIPRLLRPPERPQGVSKVSRVSMEPQELSPALLQPQVTVVAILGELLATLPSLDAMMMLLLSPSCLYWDLIDFTRELQTTLYRFDAAWWCRSVTFNDDDPPTSLSRTLAAYKSTRWTTCFHVRRATSKWQWSVSMLMNSWAQLARAATELRNTCRDLATKAADREATATATARARALQDEAARYWTAQENMVGLGQALGREEGMEVVAGHESWVRREAMLAASEATRATMVRQRVEAALGLLERLVAACDEATAFPRELQCLLRDTKATLEATKKQSINVPEDLVAKVAVAERLWEANARLGKDHLVATLDNITKFLFPGGLASPSACEVAEWCQRVIEDIPRLLQPLERPKSIPTVSPETMEIEELSLALLQPQVTVVATLCELLANLPRQDEEMLLPMSPEGLCSDLKNFTRELRESLYYIDDTWWRRDVTWDYDDPPTSDDDDDDDDSYTYDGDDPPTSLSQALAAYESTPWTRCNHVTMEASKWQLSVSVLVDSWAELVRKASKLRKACRKMATEAADRAATATSRARELQAMAARYWTAQENMVELGQALGREEGAKVVAEHESWVRREARVAASKATRATMVRQRLEAALGLLERLVATCDKATTFLRELQRRVGDIKAALKGISEASPNVPKDLVAKVAVAERLWEANARLAKDHLLGALDDITAFDCHFRDLSCFADEVAERCQRAIKDIPRLLRYLDHPQGVPKVSPMTMELQELFPALMQPQVTVVAILGELLANLPRWDREAPMSLQCLRWDLEEYSRDLRATLHCTDDTWWHNIVTSDDGPVTSFSQALAAFRSTPWAPQNRVTMAASKWQQSVAVLVDSWAQLARKATQLRNTWREVATEAADRVATATAQARELQDEAARYGTAQENMVELGQALGREEGAEVVARREAQMRRKARVAASEARRATMVRQRVEAALGLLERLVAACDEATAFPRELQCRVGAIEAALKGTNVASPDVPEDLVVKVAVAEWLWEASARLVKGHLEGTLNDINAFYYGYGHNSLHYRGVAERCQRVIKDIPRLLRPLECPQSIPRVSPVDMEPQELSPALLQPQVTVVAIVGELLATLPSLDEEMLLVSPGCLYWELEEFTSNLWVTLYGTDATWCCRNVTSNDDYRLTSLSQALAAYKSTPWTTWDDVTMVASKWQWSVSMLMNSWAQLAMKATKLCNTWKGVANDAADRVAFYNARARALQDEAARYGTAQENIVELGQALGREEGADVVARHEAWVRREVKVSASEATRATMERQQAGVALGLLERLAAVCDEATAFPRELQRLLRDIEATLKETNEASLDVPEDLVAKVADAERLCEANAHLAKDHLAKTVRDIIKFLFPGGPASLSAREVAERCQRAIEDIPRLLRPLEYPQSVPKVFPVTMELQELSPALLQPQVTVVAILGDLLATLPSEDEINLLFTCRSDFYRDLRVLTWELRDTRHCTEDWRHCTVTWDDDDPVTSLSQALAAWESTPGMSQKRVTMAARNWQGLVNALVNSWARLARIATKLPNACRDLATKAANRAATATSQARELQDEAARYGTAQENMVELGQALGREEGAEVVARHEAQVRREAMVAASEARRATMVRQRLEASLGLLERLVAACDEATAFPRELQRLLKAIKAALKGTIEASPKVSEDLVAKVAVAEQLWEANARLAKDHLEGTLQGSIIFHFNGDGPTSPSACGVAGQCQRAMEYIARLLRPPEHPQSVPKVSPVSMELQKLSPALLQPEVTAVAILGELLASLPRQDEEMYLHVPKCLYWDLKNFTSNLRFTLYCTDNTWWRHSVTSGDDDPVTSLSRALAACESTRGTTWDNVTKAASEWQWSVSVHVYRWAELARTATELRNTCREVVTEAADREASATAWARDLQALAARDGTAQENMVELGQALVREEGAEMEDRYETQVRRDARVAAREATRATMERQQAEAALGLLERLVAACDEATAFPQELQCLLWDTKAALKGTSEASPNVPEDLVAKVAVAEQLWEAKRRLAKDHLLRAVPGTSKFYFTGGPASPSACEVAEWCQRAIEDIPRLLRPPEHPQSVLNVSPVSVELQEPSLSQLLEALVSVVATLGEVTATVTGPYRGVRRCVPPKLLHAALRIFTWSLRKALERPGVSSLDDPGVPSLGQTLATLGATPGATWADVRATGSAWQELVAACEERWKQLFEEITKLRDACEDAALAWARDQQDKAIRRGTAGDNLAATAQQLMVALDRDEEASAGATHSAQVMAATSEAMGEAVVAPRPVRAAIRRRHWAEMALEPLQRLVDACDKGSEFISYMECQLRDIEAALEGTKEASPDVPEDLVAKVAKAEQLWEASTRLFRHHLLGTLGDIHDLLLSPYGGCGGPNGPGSRAVADRCQKAIEEIPRLLQDSDITAATSSRQ